MTKDIIEAMRREWGKFAEERKAMRVGPLVILATSQAARERWCNAGRAVIVNQPPPLEQLTYQGVPIVWNESFAAQDRSDRGQMRGYFLPSSLTQG